MNNLPKVVTQQRRGRDSNPRLLDRKSDALPLSHRATKILISFLKLEWCNLIVFLYIIHIIFVNMSAKRYYFTL